MRYRLTYLLSKVVYVSLDVAHADQLGKVKFEGEPFSVELVRDKLFSCPGMDGHLIADETTPVDLATAMLSPSMYQFKPELLSGSEVLRTNAQKEQP